MKQKTWMFFIIISLAVPAGLAASYTIEDLEILASTNSYLEFIKHAKDIKPSQRKVKWKKLVIEQSIGLLDELRKEKNYKKSSFALVEDVANWPTLKKDEFFQLKRNAYTIEYFKHCFSTEKVPSVCQKELNSFWLRSNKDTDTGYKLAELVAGFMPQHDQWELIGDILKSEQSHFYCQKSLIKKSFVKHLKEITIDAKNDYARKIKLQNIADIKCWNVVLPELKKELWSSSPSMSKNVYRTLTSFNQLSLQEEDLWLTLYLLDNPQVGNLFNISWNRLKELANNFDRRNVVHRKLKRMDPLPGNSFNHKSQAITRHFNKHFPEYIATYAQTCIDYLEGTRHFSYGNPTLYCDQLFARDKEQRRRMIPHGLHSRYSVIKNN